jgi:hypothetical protein
MWAVKDLFGCVSWYGGAMRTSGKITTTISSTKQILEHHFVICSTHLRLLIMSCMILAPVF